MDKLNENITRPYDIKFDHSQTDISFLVLQILSTSDNQDIDGLTGALIMAVKIHLDNKKSCNKEKGPDYSACLKRIIIEDSGLNLIEDTLLNDHTDKLLQKVVRGWFRDNFWMIEAECLRCGK